METITYYDEVREIIREMGGWDIDLCKQCGLCAGSCPWGKMEKESEFIIRKMLHMGRMGVEGFESDDVLFACTTCKQCVIKCPRSVNIINVIKAMRTIICETGGIPKNLKSVLGSINSNGNPWGQDEDKRTSWVKDLDIATFEDQEYLLYVCCTSAYDSQKIARSTASLLQKAGVSFGIIGNNERCCGEATRKIGAEEDFTHLVEHNLELFNEKDIKKIITTSPHCYYTFSQEYSEWAHGKDLEVYHYTQIFAQLLKDGKLKFNKPFNKKVIYHEPCYLGRHSEVYEQPRELLRAVPGLELVDYDKNRSESLCCGGGGARIWMETEAGLRFSDEKVKEASDKQVQVIATACPYCVVMLEDSCKNLNKDEEIKVMDISQILIESL